MKMQSKFNKNVKNNSNMFLHFQRKIWKDKKEGGETSLFAFLFIRLEIKKTAIVIWKFEETTTRFVFTSFIITMKNGVLRQDNGFPVYNNSTNFCELQIFR